MLLCGNFKINFLILNTGYFTSDNNELDEIENATHNTFAKLTWIFVFRFKKHKTWLAVQFCKF
jgi:cytochrome b561